MIVKSRQDGNVVVFELEGQLDFETTMAFQQTCRAMIDGEPTKRVIFNLARLKFVGSSGINQFIKVLKDFNARPTRPRFVQLSSEFEKIFRAYQTSRRPFEIFEEETLAIASFDLPEAPPKPARKKKTEPTEN